MTDGERDTLQKSPFHVLVLQLYAADSREAPVEKETMKGDVEEKTDGTSPIFDKPEGDCLLCSTRVQLR